MAKQITNLAPTTELEAVNAMLASIGEAPIDTLDSATQADVRIAIAILRNATREVQSMGWRFNTEFGFEIAPSAAYDYTDSSGVTTRLGIYAQPQGLIAFEMSQSPDQQGSRYADAVIRPVLKRAEFGVTAPGVVNGITVGISPYFAATTMNASFKSVSGTGASVPMTVTFSSAVDKVTVTCMDPQVEGNLMTAYGAADVVLGQVAFDWYPTPGVNVPSTRSIEAAGIVKIILTPAPLDFVQYTLSFAVDNSTVFSGPCFYDRARNRDGWPLNERKHLYIDATWLFDFEQIPETARNYIVVQSSRRLAQKQLGSAELASFSQQDELRALRNLKRDQGENDDYNMFSQGDVAKHLGLRPRTGGGVFDDRSSAGPVVPVVS